MAMICVLLTEKSSRTVSSSGTIGLYDGSRISTWEYISVDISRSAETRKLDLGLEKRFVIVLV